MFKHVCYGDLNPRQQEDYNFQKIASRLADYEFNCRLSNDLQGVDFIASHIDGKTSLKVQLRGRLAVDRKYRGKDIYIAFRSGVDFYVYPHDKFLKTFLAYGLGKKGKQWWEDNGFRHWPQPPQWAIQALSEYKV